MDFPRFVYVLTNTVTGKAYVGSSIDPERRKAQHLYDLEHGNHSVKDMQADYDEYGDHFSFFVVDEIPTIREKSKEYSWMQKLKTLDRQHGYNYQDPWLKRMTCDTKLMYQYQGHSRRIRELNEISGIPKPVLYYRLSIAGWEVDKALSTPVRKQEGNNGSNVY